MNVKLELSNVGKDHDEGESSSGSTYAQDSSKVLQIYGDVPSSVENLGDLIRAALSESKTQKSISDNSSEIGSFSSELSSPQENTVMEEPTEAEILDALYNVPIREIARSSEKSFKIDLSNILSRFGRIKHQTRSLKSEGDFCLDHNRAHSPSLNGKNDQNIFAQAASCAVPWGAWPIRLRNQHGFQFFSLSNELNLSSDDEDVHCETPQVHRYIIDSDNIWQQVIDSNTIHERKRACSFQVHPKKIAKLNNLGLKSHSSSNVPLPLKTLLKESWQYETNRFYAEKGNQLAHVPRDGSELEKTVLADIEAAIEAVLWHLLSSWKEKSEISLDNGGEYQAKALCNWKDVLDIFQDALEFSRENCLEDYEIAGKAVAGKLPKLSITSDVLENTYRRIYEYLSAH